MNTVFATTERSAASIARDVLSLFKLRIGFLIMITAVVGFFFVKEGKDVDIHD